MTLPDLGSYRVREEWIAGQTYWCDAADGRPVVLKRLPDDCLHAGGLHPAIRDRLARLRQLPHPAVSQLRGVERLPAGTFAVWDHVAGRPWAAGDPPLPVVRAFEAMHALGLVHGAIHAGNVIVAAGGGVWLLHPSPYLYDDPAADVVGLANLIGADAVGDPATVAELSERLLRAGGPGRKPGPAGTRWRPAVVAAVVVAAAVVTGIVVRRRYDRLPPPPSFPPLATRPV